MLAKSVTKNLKNLHLTFAGTIEVFQGEGLLGERKTNLKFGANPGR